MGQPNTPITTPATMPALLPQAEQAVVQMQDALATQEAQAIALAKELGYEGSLTVGALEDEIRFYQRRSVEALLETGKRLLLLREVTPRGEFDERIELLGFSRRTAYRFMQAAQKTRKSATVALLATQVKSQKAFLELVTHDDDADIERLAEMDDIDRMSASEVRTALRESKKKALDEKAAADNARKSRDERINALESEKFDLQRQLKAATQPASSDDDDTKGGSIADIEADAMVAGEVIKALAMDAMAIEAQITVGLLARFGEIKAVCLAAGGADEDERDADGFPVGLPNHAQLAMQQALMKVIQAAHVLAAEFALALPLAEQSPQATAWAAQADTVGSDWLSDLAVPNAVNADEA